MAYKQFSLDDSTTVTIYKRRANRSLRLSVAPNGEIRVTIPVWAPYQTGLDFAKSRRGWISAQQPTRTLLSSGQAIGKAHHLRFITDPAATRPASRVRLNEVMITHPPRLLATDPSVQKLAETASIRALRGQAEQLLPGRLGELAKRHGFQYNTVSVKQLKSRWGSCDQHRNIVLNLFLMQLPWEYIDYVLLHELVHTTVLRHGPDFWQALQTVLPDAKQRRQRMRHFQPVLGGGQTGTVA
jgi:predicted metal-dependent hydrolase